MDNEYRDTIKYNDIPVAVDKRVDIYINNKLYTTLYLSPEDVEDTIIGLLITDKIIDKPDKIKGVKVENNKIIIDAIVNRELKHIIYDECLSSREIDKFVRDNGFRLKWNDILNIYRDFNKSAESVRKGLAVHTCGIYTNIDEKIIVRDVSRHAALLKILGKIIKKKLDASKSVLITSGRVSSDMVYRAAILNIPIILSLHGPLSSGLSAALLAGITFVANIKRAEKKGLKVLTHQYRILK